MVEVTGFCLKSRWGHEETTVCAEWIYWTGNEMIIPPITS
jgi:hypothetical protein